MNYGEWYGLGYVPGPLYLDYLQRQGGIMEINDGLCIGMKGPELKLCNSSEVVVYDHNTDQKSMLGEGYYCAECWGDHPLEWIDGDGIIYWEPANNVKNKEA